MDLLGGGGGGGGVDLGNVDLGPALDASTSAMDARYRQLGVGGGTAQARDDQALAQEFGTQETELLNQAQQANFQLQTAANSQPSGLAQLAGLAGFGFGF